MLGTESILLRFRPKPIGIQDRTHRYNKANGGGIVETESNTGSVQPAEEIKPRNFLGRLGGVFASPREAFEEIGRSPSVLLPMILLMLMGMVSSYCLSLKVNVSALTMQPILESQVAQGNMTQEKADQALQPILNPSTGSKIFGAVSSGITIILMVLIIAGVAKLISAAFLGAENRFKAIFAVSLYVWLVPGIVHTVLFLIILYFKNPADITLLSVNSLVASNLEAVSISILGEGTLPKFLESLLGWVDLFPIWKIVLMAIGYAAVSRKLKAAKVATWIVVIYILIALIGSAGSSFLRTRFGM